MGNYTFLEHLGHMFYVVDPSKTSFRTVAEVPHYIGSAAPWFTSLIIIERIIIYKKKGLWLPVNDSLASIATGMFQEFANFFLRGALIAAYIYLYENYSLVKLPWNSLSTWILCAFGVDFFYYWSHRANHEVNILWSQHQVHHSSEEYNLSTALRQGVVQRWATWIIFLPMAFFIPPSQFAAHSQFNLLYQFWIHTEVVGNLGPLEWILNTPSHHRVHHGSTRSYIDKNYGGVLIIWDRIFGTFEAEHEEEPIVYGLTGQLQFFNPLYLQFYYYAKLYEKLKSVRGLSNKLRAIFYGPGWFPGTPRLGDYNQIPKKMERKKFARSLSPFMQIYAILHFAILSRAYTAVMLNYTLLGNTQLYGYSAYIVVSLISLGLLYDGHALAPWLEMLRCLVFLGLTIRIPFMIDSTMMHIILFTLRIFYFCSAWMFKKECIVAFKKMATVKEKVY